MQGMVRTSYLRVYQPLSAFNEAERKGWDPERAGEAGSEAPVRARWLLNGALPSSAIGTEGAFIRQVDGIVLVCPWRTRLRMLAGLLAFRSSIPEEVADAFVPEHEARKAADELLAIESRHPEVRSHILHANWHVPLRWFSAFTDEERILTEDLGGLRIRYETPLLAARERLDRAIGILEESWIDEEVTGAVKELSGWLSEFPDGCLLELDYAGVAAVFSDEDLLEDRSSADVWACLDALAAGDVIAAGRTFASLTDRWSGVRAQEVVN